MSIKNNNIKIKAISHFSKNRSSAENSIFLFSYDVEIKNNKRNKGKITFEYKDLDQLNKIIDIIKTNY